MEARWTGGAFMPCAHSSSPFGWQPAKSHRGGVVLAGYDTWVPGNSLMLMPASPDRLLLRFTTR